MYQRREVLLRCTAFLLMLGVLCLGCSCAAESETTVRMGASAEEISPSAPHTSKAEDMEQSLPDSELTAASADYRSAWQKPVETTAAGETQAGEEKETLTVTMDGKTFEAAFSDTEAAREFAALLEKGPLSIPMRDYSGFEKVGPLGRSLTTANSQITTQPGDIMLYNGSEIVIFYGTNTWSYTPIARITDLAGWEDALGSGDITAAFALTEQPSSDPSAAQKTSPVPG